jgi:hypothetical protein
MLAASITRWLCSARRLITRQPSCTIQADGLEFPLTDSMLYSAHDTNCTTTMTIAAPHQSPHHVQSRHTGLQRPHTVQHAHSSAAEYRCGHAACLLHCAAHNHAADTSLSGTLILRLRTHPQHTRSINSTTQGHAPLHCVRSHHFAPHLAPHPHPQAESACHLGLQATAAEPGITSSNGMTCHDAKHSHNTACRCSTQCSTSLQYMMQNMVHHADNSTLRTAACLLPAAATARHPSALQAAPVLTWPHNTLNASLAKKAERWPNWPDIGHIHACRALITHPLRPGEVALVRCDCVEP